MSDASGPIGVFDSGVGGLSVLREIRRALPHEDLLYVASPNILTYHPNTEITRLHEMQDKLDYHSDNLDNRPPYVYFEEAFPAVVSKNLSEAQIWTIHQQTHTRWGQKRNSNPMPETVLPDK